MSTPLRHGLFQRDAGKRAFFGNGRALDRVTKQKHRPNRQKCPKTMFAVPPDNSWTFFGYFFNFFRTFCQHSLFWAVQRFARYKPFSGKNPRKKAILPLSRGRNRKSQGIDNRGSLISVSCGLQGKWPTAARQATV